MMKRLMTALLSFVLLFSVAAIPAAAQTNGKRLSRYARTAPATRYDRSYENGDYRDYEDERSRDGSVWHRHRDKITTAAGAAGGAILGGIIGGRRGAAIGAITGGAGAAVYTYKIRKSDRRRY